VRDGLEASDLGTRRQIITALVKQIEIDSEQVNIVYKIGPSPFDSSPTVGNGPHCWGRSKLAWGNVPGNEQFRIIEPYKGGLIGAIRLGFSVSLA
jgi:hypothetical protein